MTQTTHGSHAVTPAGSSAGSSTEQASLGELFSRLTGDVSELMRKEVALAKVELKEEAVKSGKAGGAFGAAAVCGWLMVSFLSFALAWLLDAVMPRSLAFFLVALLYGIAGAVAFSIGKKKAKEINPKPEQTIQTLKEDVQWARAQTS